MQDAGNRNYGATIKINLSRRARTRSVKSCFVFSHAHPTLQRAVSHESVFSGRPTTLHRNMFLENRAQCLCYVSVFPGLRLRQTAKKNIWKVPLCVSKHYLEYIHSNS